MQLTVFLIGYLTTLPVSKLYSVDVVHGVLGGVKDCRRVRLTNSPPSVSRHSRENMGASTSHNPMDFRGLLQG
jgi:hypothetical protein